MNCRTCSNLISAYLDRELDGNAMIRIRQHIDECQECRAEYEDLKEIRDRLINLPMASPAADLDIRLKMAVFGREEQKRRRSTAAFAIGLTSLTAAAAAIFVFNQGTAAPKAPESVSSHFEKSSDLAYGVSIDPFNTYVPALNVSHTDRR